MLIGLIQQFLSLVLSKWKKSQYGWSTTDEPDDLVYDFEVLDEWREAFTGKIEEEKNIVDGVGRFGL